MAGFSFESLKDRLMGKGAPRDEDDTSARDVQSDGYDDGGAYDDQGYDPNYDDQSCLLYTSRITRIRAMTIRATMIRIMTVRAMTIRATTTRIMMIRATTIRIMMIRAMTIRATAIRAMMMIQSMARRMKIPRIWATIPTSSETSTMKTPRRTPTAPMTTARTTTAISPMTRATRAITRTRETAEPASRTRMPPACWAMCSRTTG